MSPSEAAFYVYGTVVTILGIVIAWRYIAIRARVLLDNQRRRDLLDLADRLLVNTASVYPQEANTARAQLATVLAELRKL